MILELPALLTGYLLGSISTGLLVSKLSGEKDIRQKGSGNIGATNILRVIGKKAGAITLLGDMLKAVVAIMITGLYTDDLHILALAGLASVVGHIFPVYYSFKGGKGVATALGMLFYLSPLSGLIVLAVFVATLYSSRYVSLGSILGSLTAPLSILFFDYNLTLFASFIVVFFLICYMHRENIKRLLNGTENRL
ncbi:MAG: glycerol-3-phosphate 1-O-acyltransferase PlsY [Nitrospinae bacterium]|nr:glycerol-3-phosphate 1-O-acyltransferase PlsY [Nitrospinota bacterium]